MEYLPVVTKYMADGTTMQVVEGEALCNAVAPGLIYKTWRHRMRYKFNLVSGQDFITESGLASAGRVPVKYYFSLPTVQRITEFYQPPVSCQTPTADTPVAAATVTAVTSPAETPETTGTAPTVEEREEEEIDNLLEIFAEIAEYYAIRDSLQAAALAAELLTGKDCFQYLYGDEETCYSPSEIGARYGVSGFAVNKKLTELGIQTAEKRSWGKVYTPVRVYSHLSRKCKSGYYGWNGGIFIYLDRVFSRKDGTTSTTRTAEQTPTIDETLTLFGKLRNWLRGLRTRNPPNGQSG